MPEVIVTGNAVPATWLAARAEIGSRAGRSACCVTRICRWESALRTPRSSLPGLQPKATAFFLACGGHDDRFVLVPKSLMFEAAARCL